MPYVTTADRTRLFVKDWGSGRPVVFLHGWPLSADSWDDHALAVAEAGFRSISYDRRGFGRSTQPWSGYDYDTLSDDLAAVIEQTGADDAVLVGFSMGGGEVVRYLSRHGHKSVRKAVLVSSVVPYMLKTDSNPQGTEQAVFDDMGHALRKDRAAFFTEFVDDFYGVGLVSLPVSEEVLEWTRSMAMQAGLRATLECAKAFATTDFRAELSAFTLPTLVIHGTEDRTVPIDAAGRAAAEAILNARLIEYDNAPHGLFATHKQTLTNDLLAFLRT